VDAEPERTNELNEAMQCWNFLGGYTLANLGLYDALYPLADPQMTLALLIEIRDGLAER